MNHQYKIITALLEVVYTRIKMNAGILERSYVVYLHIYFDVVITGEI